MNKREIHQTKHILSLFYQMDAFDNICMKQFSDANVLNLIHVVLI